MSLNNYQWQVIRMKPTKTVGVFNLDDYAIYPGWRNHPNFSWGGPGNQRPQHPPGFQQPPYQQEKKPNLEEMLTKFIAKLHINLPFIEALSGMPNVVKFLKELLENKWKLDDASHVELNVVCSAILQNKLPNKLKDPESFTIHCLIGSLNVNNALADLGANINVMPYKMFKQLGLKKPKQTRISIQLENKTIRFIRDMEEDSNMLLILRRPFLEIARTIIDVGTGELILRVGDDTIKLQARDSEKPKVHDESKRHLDEREDETTKFKVGDKVLLDDKDPRIATSELNTNGATPFTILNIFSYGTVENDLFQLLQLRPLEVGRCINWAALEQVQLAHLVHFHLDTAPWDRFFSIIEPIYSDLTLEFCTTFHLQHMMNTHDEAGTIVFRLGRLVRHMSVPEFKATLGFYTEEFIASENFLQLHHHIYYSSSCCWIDLTASTVPYDTSRSKVTFLPPALHYIHAILVHTLTWRRESTGVVSTTDAYFL
ncbi:hypothetical protein PVK06_018578 [Gossypium arboreum]|uniref:Arabidopsis retrotransposon Orf1 C-terminal domain-containing protein n=1 Tax=Gossypium arboreum TaxID=29729 RepID=A0ABR0PI02_GOSAR|nr:hypothetical protein PVK06_018578 [Gossypium arboreum]